MIPYKMVDLIQVYWGLNVPLKLRGPLIVIYY